MASDGTTPALEDDQTDLDSARDPVPRDPRRTRIGRILGAIVIVVAIIVAVVFGLTAGVPDSQVVAHVAALHDLPATRPSPGPGQEVGGMRTPDLQYYRWTPQGARLDVVGTHSVATAFFSRGGRLLAVSVISGGPVSEPGPVVITPGGVPVHKTVIDTRTVLSWRRGGHTMVMSSIAVPTLWMINLVTALNPAPPRHAASSAAAG
jgi:hypothetical protein